MKPLWMSKRWTVLVLGILVLALLALTGAPAEAVNALAWGVGGAIAVFVGGESWVDRERARSRSRRESEEP